MSKVLLFFILLPLNLLAQEFVSSNSFDDKTAKGIAVVEFWAEWNKSNEVSFLGSLKDCNPYKINISISTDIQKEYNIFAIPTIIVFNNGIESYRFNPNIMMQLEADMKEVQSVIDEITLSKFQ